MTNQNENKNNEFQTEIQNSPSKNGINETAEIQTNPNKKTENDKNKKDPVGFFTTKRIVRAATIAAMYVVLTLASGFFGLAYGPVQFRLGEALTILPLFFPEAIAGLTIGCFISNLFSTGNLALELTLGTSATLTAAFLTYLIGKFIKKDIKIGFAILPPIFINAFVVPITFLMLTDLKEFYWISALQVGAGQTAVLIALGIPLYFLMKRLIKNSIILQ